MSVAADREYEREEKPTGPVYPSTWMLWVAETEMASRST